MHTKPKYILNNWKLGYHILVGTNRFGVNNKLWEQEKYGWMFGVPLWKQFLRIMTIKPLVTSYKLMKFRAISCGFMHPKNALLLWPNDKGLKAYKE